MNRINNRMHRANRPRLAWQPALAASLALPLLAAASQAAPTSALQGKADAPTARTLAARPVSGWSSVILKTAGPLTPAQEAQVAALGGDVTRHLSLIGAVAVRVPAHNLARLTALPFVTHVSQDGMVRKSDEFTVGSSEAGQAFAPDGDGGTYQLTGRGVTVAVIDSGVAPVRDLGGKSPLPLLNMAGRRRVTSYSFLPPPPPPAKPVPGAPPPPPPPNPADPCGHGTHVAGIIAGNGARSSDPNSFRHFYGIAPQANIVSVRVLDQNGTTMVSTVVAALQWVVAYNAGIASGAKGTANLSPVRVINLSLGHPVGESYTTDPLCQAVEAAYNAGIMVVCAAGNSGRASAVNDPSQGNEGWGTAYGSIQSPGNDPYVLTVGATKSTDGQRADDRIATYSSRGPSRLDLVMKPDIIAPGNKVISLNSNNSTLDNYAGGSNDIPQSLYRTVLDPTRVSSDYFRLSGTSMAAPVVAGAAALLLQADPTLTPDTLKARLMLSADKWADPQGGLDPLTYGAGYLNIPAALACTAVATLPALSPTLAQNADGSISLVMNRIAWGTTATAGSRIAWGTGLWGTGVTDLRIAWGTSVVCAPGTAADRIAWGTNVLTASRIAWGTDAISSSRIAWGTSAVWADRIAWGTSTSAADLTWTALLGE